MSDKKEAKFKVGDKVRLVNEWSKQFGADGVAAVVKQVRENADGSFVYFVDAERPPIPVQAVEAKSKSDIARRLRRGSGKPVSMQVN